MSFLWYSYIEGFQAYDIGADTTYERGTILSLDNEHTIAKVLHEVEPISTESSMGESNSKVKVVINYADHVKQQMTSTDYQQAANSSENDNQS